MCGVIAAIGKVDHELLQTLVHESEVRGTHNTGFVKLSNKVHLYHTRYCTSGDDHQPISHGGRYLIFNGVISMGTKKQMEKQYGIKMATDNDGEVFLQLCSSPESMLEFINNPLISFAGVTTIGKRVVALRNERRPLWQAHFKGCTYLASTKDIFKRSGIKVCIELEPLKVYEWRI